ncbi:hypothetical protein DFJ58DRAFT_765319 [Suillus subalutaceus]|uniref:uncharacterized protein n=1 Tax=Suillus subalutaceus TaxID=48586 RepID=UPI001B867513|nr:uncharacterized protein DFJ58DRAFT_765319 [Suillus subalutaceus]KAG1870255.1 hypothetical protein DFJ58DRAFT_765319 [Suillus subalutaceus]
MIPPFSVPVYEPLPYSLSGLSFTQLPMCTQHYLLEIAKLVPPHAHKVNSILDERSIISLALYINLLGNDITLVNLRHETITMARDLERGIPPQASAQWHLAMQNGRLQTVLGTLLPERELIFNEFMIKFDALVWLDQEGRENYTPEDWQRYRNALLKPILDHTSERLVARDECVRNLAVINGYYYRAPSLPYSRLGSPRLDASRTCSRRSATCGPDSGEDCPRGRMSSRHS